MLIRYPDKRGFNVKISDRLELMRLFVRIAEAGSVSAAARSLALSQPSASRQLRQLEKVLGVQLIHRSTHELNLTDAGRLFLDEARAMLANWENTTDKLRSERDELTGSIRVAAPVAFGQTILAKIAARFLLRHPSVSIEWRLIDEPGDLVVGGYDLWLRAGPVREPGLIVRSLWRIERTIVTIAGSAPASHPKMLADRPAVVLFTYVPREISLLGPRGQVSVLKPKAAFRTDNIYAAIVAAKEGVGYSIMPFWAIQDDLNAGHLMQLCPSWHPPAVFVSAAYPPARYRPRRVEAFLSFLRTEMPQAGAGIVATT